MAVATVVSMKKKTENFKTKVSGILVDEMRLRNQSADANGRQPEYLGWKSVCSAGEGSPVIRAQYCFGPFELQKPLGKKNKARQRDDVVFQAKRPERCVRKPK